MSARKQLLTLWLCLAVAPPLHAAAPMDDRVGGIIVKLEEATGAAGVSTAMAQSLSVTAGHTLRVARQMSGNATLLQLDAALDRATAEAMAADISRRADVRYAVPNYRRWPSLVPNDTRYADQWYLHAASVVSGAANLEDAWDITTGSASTVVAVLDTGILGNHADLSRILNGYDFVQDNAALGIDDNDTPNGRDSDATDPGDAVLAGECAGFPSQDQDSSWHGTLVTGVIGATSDNSLGIAGIDRSAQMLPVRVLGKCGGTDADIVDGARWAMGMNVPGVPANPNPARILNLSLGGFGPCTAVYQDAFDDAERRGVIVVVSAGNELLDLDADGADITPAECEGAFTIAATTRQGGETLYTNIGSAVDLAAPGGTASTVAEGILTTTDGGATTALDDSSYEPVIGTSFSAPIVSGILALALALNDSLTPEQLKLTLTFNARDFPTGTTDGIGDCTTSRCGAGLVDAHAVVSAVQSGTIPGFFADGAKIEVLGSNSSRSKGLAAAGILLVLAVACAVRYGTRRRR